MTLNLAFRTAMTPNLASERHRYDGYLSAFFVYISLVFLSAKACFPDELFRWVLEGDIRSHDIHLKCVGTC